MGPLPRPRGTYSALGKRALASAFLVVILGLFSCSIVWVICEETGTRTFDPVWQTSLWEWNPERVVEDLPIALTMLLVSVVGGLAAGAHSAHAGGLLGFSVMLFNLIPVYVQSGAHGMDDLHASPLVWAAFLIGLLLAFYAGDFGSWRYRRRLIREALESEMNEDEFALPLPSPATR